MQCTPDLTFSVIMQAIVRILVLRGYSPVRDLAWVLGELPTTVITITITNLLLLLLLLLVLVLWQ